MHDVFGASNDVSNLSAERNVFRYLPFEREVLVRLGESGNVADLVRVVAAAAAAGARVRVSSAIPLTPAVASAIASAASGVDVEDNAGWIARVQTYGAGN